MDLEAWNLRQIEQLNQRGGRTLSIVDLIQAGTLSVEMAAYAMRAMAEGASLLTGARPGGAGKSTLLGAILGLLPPDVRIVTVDGPEVIQQGLAQPADEPACYLAHEIGSGHWYGYIWGQEVADFFWLHNYPGRVLIRSTHLTGQYCLGIMPVPHLTLKRPKGYWVTRGISTGSFSGGTEPI